MNIYILGICGTFMAGLAQIAREQGHRVSGSDANVYPPMSTQLEQAGIDLDEGFNASSLPADCDMFIIGNAISRGNEQFEEILERGYRYTSGPQWLYENLLHQRWVLAVAGTHGKTTTSAMLAWIFEEAGMEPGYLIGGMMQNLPQSAKLGKDPFFIIEADEYDSALFDKRSKFIHYHPRTLILNNLEFDHADIFDDLAAIQRQFHHLVRTLPASALVVFNDDDAAIREALELGLWSERTGFSNSQTRSDFHLNPESELIETARQEKQKIQLAQAGGFNALNASAAIIAARHAGVPFATSVKALESFKGVKRRQEIIAEINGIRIIDDFAHHPTAIELTLEALQHATEGNLIAVLDIRSNTMRMGVHAKQLGQALDTADQVLLCDNPNLNWDMRKLQAINHNIVIKPDTGQIIQHLVDHCQPGDQIVIMSNGGFDNIHQRLIRALQI
ncbi:MAG: UDP-N-acetylmuramate:L-alanyl-gamma-D-glutamyl-meso-diaminopimelate ligase [Pseudomonadota bacterium]